MGTDKVRMYIMRSYKTRHLRVEMGMDEVNTWYPNWQNIMTYSLFNNASQGQMCTISGEVKLRTVYELNITINKVRNSSEQNPEVGYAPSVNQKIVAQTSKGMYST